jgi:single-strand DNA-binding protein
MIYNFATVIMDGFVANHPESRFISRHGKTVTNFVIAVNHFTLKEEDKKTSFIHVETWDKVAEACINHLKKGNRVTVEGDLREDRWKDDKGNNFNKIKVVARRVRFG